MGNAHHNVEETLRLCKQTFKQLRALDDDALDQAIATAADDPVGDLITVFRQRFRGKRAGRPSGRKISARSRARLDDYNRGAEHERRVREDGYKETAEEWEEWFELYYGAVCKIALGGIENRQEAVALNTAITLGLARLNFVGTLDEAIDSAMCIAFDEVSTNEIAWLIALARFRLRGFGAPPWIRPAPQVLG